MLPEILDSRHNRHMPIRNPEYIIDAQEKASKKKISKLQTIEENEIERKDSGQENKQFEKTALLTDVTNPAILTDTEQDSDCILVSYLKNKRKMTTDEIAKRKKVLDDTITPLDLIEKNVLPVQNKLNDDSLDTFLRIVRETACFKTQSVQYIEFPELITANDTDKCLQIIGGNCTDHWRCIFFDGTKLRVYDSIPNCTYEKLAAKEKNYIHKRFPKINVNDIIFEKVQNQPDHLCCGIYAAAFATDIVLGKSPCQETYSRDVVGMRRHFLTIIENDTLSFFPRE